MDKPDALGILQQLERGEISADEANARLNAPPVERIATPPFDRSQLPAWVRQIWLIPLTLGVLVVVLGTWIIAGPARDNILWFFIGLPVVLLGTLLTTIGASAFSGHWLYVNVQESRTRHRAIRFGLPFPLGLLRFALGLAQFKRPRPGARVNVSTSRMDFNAVWENPAEFIRVLERELDAGRGITVDVDDKDERVQVYIV